MDFGKTVFLFLSVLGIAWWIGTVMKADGEDKYIEACTPVTLTTKYLIKVSTGLVGFTPKWTQAVKKKLDGGCYYFFATFLFAKGVGQDTEEAVRQEAVTGYELGGGVRQEGVTPEF